MEANRINEKRREKEKEVGRQEENKKCQGKKKLEKHTKTDIQTRRQREKCVNDTQHATRHSLELHGEHAVPLDSKKKKKEERSQFTNSLSSTLNSVGSPFLRDGEVLCLCW